MESAYGVVIAQGQVKRQLAVGPFNLCVTRDQARAIVKALEPAMGEDFSLGWITVWPFQWCADVANEPEPWERTQGGAVAPATLPGPHGPGQRYTAMLGIGRRIVQRNPRPTIAFVSAVLCEMNGYICNPPLPDSEVEMLAKWAVSEAGKGERGGDE